MPGEDKRRLERFNLGLPSQVSVGTGLDQEIIDLFTRDISSDGAYFHTDAPLPVGTAVKIDLIISLDELKKIESRKALIKVSGEVVRSENKGMAICFEKDYKIIPIDD
jgi:hypothetical protein